MRCELKSIFDDVNFHPDPEFANEKRRKKRLEKYEKDAAKKLKAQGLRDDFPNWEIALERAKRRLYDDDPDFEKYRKGNFIKDTAVAVILTLQVKDNIGVGNNVASAHWSSIPIPAGLFALKATGGLNGTGRRTSNYKMSLYMSEVVTVEGCENFSGSRPTTIRLSGSFGLASWLKRTVHTAFETDSIRHFTSTGVTLEFTLTPTLGVTPTWSIVNSNKSKFDGTFGLGGQCDYQNTMDFVLAAIADSPGPAIVFVSNLDPRLGSGPFKMLEGTKREFRALGTTSGGVDPATQQRLDNGLFDLQQRGTVRIAP
jgi:hypothetical protein